MTLLVNEVTPFQTRNILRYFFATINKVIKNTEKCPLIILKIDSQERFVKSYLVSKFRNKQESISFKHQSAGCTKNICDQSIKLKV